MDNIVIRWKDNDNKEYEIYIDRINFEIVNQARGDLESFKVVQKGGTSENVQNDQQIASIRHWFRKILRARDERDFETNLAEPC